MELSIEKLVYGGDGLARVDGEDGRRKTVFVPLVLPGERVEAAVTDERPGFARARLGKVVVPAPERVSPPCPYFGECGGCHYQQATYEAQLRYKTIDPARDCRTHCEDRTAGDNGARFAAAELSQSDADESRAGTKWWRRSLPWATIRLASHSLLAVKECPISSPLINRGIQAMWSLAVTHELPKGLVEIEFFADHDDQSLLIEFVTEQSFDEKQLREFAKQLKASVTEIAGIAAVPRSSEETDSTVATSELDSPVPGAPLMLAGSRSLQYKVGEFAYRVSAGAFFQTNRFLTQTLLDLVTADASGKLALDLYAGVGLFTLSLAKSFERVTAVESARASFRDLIANAPATVKPIESTTELFLENFRGSKPDFVVVDPPRSGLGKRVVKGLAKLAPRQITYVSCDPSTLARDLPALLAAGYRVTKAHMIDLFPQTFHIESVIRLVR